MKVCQAESGHVTRIVCPYHQWSYARSGELMACGGMDMDGDLDRHDFGLHRVLTHEVGALIFVCLGEDPTPFEDAAQAPYSTKREYNVIRYTEWYLHAIARPEHPEGSVARRICASRFPPAR
jgi:phenylpropionate dioxygenase-like ring-hydroxylating dioxygenase large terminal subunit